MTAGAGTGQRQAAATASASAAPAGDDEARSFFDRKGGK